LFRILISSSMSSTQIDPIEEQRIVNGVYQSTHKIRLVTAASLFDGHDASINIMRRILQSSGAEVIHLGHNRSVSEIVDCALQEDVQGIAISSYQGGHMEYFSYMIDLLREKGASHIKVFGGGGGVIVDEEIAELHKHGVTRIFSVEDGRSMGLQGMINHILEQCDFDTVQLRTTSAPHITRNDPYTLGILITALENGHDHVLKYDGESLHVAGKKMPTPERSTPVLGITGTGGAGKSSLTDEIILRFRNELPDVSIAIISVDPSKKRSGGALLGDRIRMNSIHHPNFYMRSMATRAENRATSASINGVVELCRHAGFDFIIVETSGIGQSDTEITEIADVTAYVMTSEFGAATQLEKINMLDFADVVVINKFEKKGSQDALRAVRKQYKRNLNLWHAEDATLPIYPTMASQFNDEGVNRLFAKIVDIINDRYATKWTPPNLLLKAPAEDLHVQSLIPGSRQRYLSEIADSIRSYHRWATDQAAVAHKWHATETTAAMLTDAATASSVSAMAEQLYDKLDAVSKSILKNWDEMVMLYRGDVLETRVRDKVITNDLNTISLSGLKIPRVAVPKYRDRGDQLIFALKENLPGFFPYTAGVFPFKRTEEDPARMFAGEGTPERTNRRFHYISEGLTAKRLSTAFDSVTLYGEDPAIRPDIYGKIGNSGVSICTLDDMKKLYSGFELTDPMTSVSMTINGPAPMILAMFMNTAIDQEVERHLRRNGLWESAILRAKSIIEATSNPVPIYFGNLPLGNDGFGLGLLGISGDKLIDADTYHAIRAETLRTVRGTVQADILKEDQAQNTCIFSTEFALRMMGDVQAFFTANQVRNYYSVSISGYHIAEAGANPITQAAFTLANGFTFVEYYLSRGMSVDEFAHNLSFFFSNGLDPEYAVIGRVARRIWSIAMKNRYKANERSQKLKYHIQTSGRSLHAQEIQFNDIRTTLQALMAIYDNCNSLHTNAYDEAITTPTEESVRRALAIQLIINKELGMAKNENALQGSFIIEELTDLVEEAIMVEFDRLTERGGVLGAMETMYQRGKIQDESLHYETLKHDGSLPIIGVNTFIDKKGGSEQDKPLELIRSTEVEKRQQIENLELFQSIHANHTQHALQKLTKVAQSDGNVFAELMETVKVASLGQISTALYLTGGQYRRNV
jgi:methylmalonyl-CoA mutase